MAETFFTATRFQDPLFATMRNEVKGCSDSYPVLMLPVRLETRFAEREVFKFSNTIPQTISNNVVGPLLNGAFHWQTIVKKAMNLGLPQDPTKIGQLIQELNGPIDCFNDTLMSIKTVPEISRRQRQFVNSVVNEQLASLRNLNLSGNTGLSQKFNQARKVLNDISDEVKDIPRPRKSLFQPGFDAFKELENLENSLKGLYGLSSIEANQIDIKINNVESIIQRFVTIVQDPGFMVNEETIWQIGSKISFIKSWQKNSPVKLTNFTQAYSGTLNLASQESQLTKQIKDLKTRIDKDFTPYMKLLAKMEMFPALELKWMIERCCIMLEAANAVGYPTADHLLNERTKLYSRLRRIRQCAHVPLYGSLNEIGRLKLEYRKLEGELHTLIEKSHEVIPRNRAHRVGLSRLRTHLTREYLQDLKELMPQSNLTESQVISSLQVRQTAKAYKATADSIKTTKDKIKNIVLAPRPAMLNLLAELKQLENKIKIKKSRTFLLPRDIYRENLNLFQSLTDHIKNFYTRNRIPENHNLKPDVEGYLESIKANLSNQKLDVFDKRDPFYDEYRKSIKFVAFNEIVKELWVRFYPDDIAIDNHDERLTQEELQAGMDYYNEVYALPPAKREEAKLPAWRVAASTLGARRAAYVINKVLPPKVAMGQVPVIENSLPELINEIMSPFQFHHKLLQRSLKRSLFTTSSVESVFSKMTPTQRDNYSLFLQNLPSSLNSALTPNNFSPCTSTRKDLELLKKITSDLLSVYENPRFKDQNPGQPFNNEREALEISYQVIINYYQTNLIELNAPFNPNLSPPTGIDMRTKEWDRAGITSVMPDKFVVATKRGNQWIHIVVGNPVSDTLNVGLDPNTTDEDGFYHDNDGELVIPEKLRWMFDFEAAVKAGMAVRIPINEEDMKEGFSLVMAFGIKTHNGVPKSNRPIEGQKLLDQLIKNHLYSDGGLEYLPVGTATNNTDAVKSPYTTLDDDYDGLFELFVKKSSQDSHSDNNQDALSITDGKYFKDALGIPSDIAELIRNHEKQDIAESKAMSRLLFGATLGIHMRFMLRNLLTSNDMREVIPFMFQNVSTVGNLPSFRIDKQPYGLIPITLHDKINLEKPSRKGTHFSFVHKLSMFLNITRKILEDQIVGKVNTINSEEYSKDPQKVFLEILGLNPYSKQFLFREGANVGNRWGDLSRSTIPNNELLQWSEDYAVNPLNVSDSYNDLLEELGHTTEGGKIRALLNTRCYGARYVNSSDITGYSVQHPDYGREKLADFSSNNQEASSFYGIYPKNYIGYFLKLCERPNVTGLFSIDKSFPIDRKINTLLFELLRISLMYDRSQQAKLAAHKIANLEVPVIERLLSSHLDICSHRIDAWQSGLAFRQLSFLRRQKPSGIFIGAYGFVENLHPTQGEKEVAKNLPNGLEPKNGKDAIIMPDNQGFIHGPSLNHAVTAAVLRAGYNSQKNKEGASKNVFAINLSSARVRKALHLLEGVANGQEMGALLGYQLERALHEGYKDTQGNHLEMNSVIFRLRKKFPTYSDNLIDKTSAGVQDEALKAMNVVDGLELIDHMEDYRPDKNKSFAESLIQQSGASLQFNGYPFGLVNILPSLSNSEGAATVALNRQKIAAIIKEIDNMADALDAMGDLITAEGVYQLVRGNHTKASAILSAMSEGRIPTDPDIIRNLREGNMVMQRVMLTMEPGEGPTPWNVNESPRSLAEPAINKWLASQLGNPTEIEWRAVFGNNVHFFNLIDLGLQPIDIISIVNNGEDGLAELELRAARVAHLHGANPQDTVTIDFFQSSSTDKANLGEQLSLIQQLGKAITNARVADARDFRLPEDEENFGQGAPAIDTTELLERLTNVVNRYRVLRNGLSQFTPGATLTGAQLSSANNFCIELANYGFKEYFPDVTQELESGSLSAKLISAREKIAQQLERAEELLSELPLELEQAKWLSTAHEIGELLFGRGFKILPRLSISEADDLKNRMESAYNGGILRNISPEGLESWLNDVSMVRKNLAPVDTLRMLTEACRGEKIEFSVAQLPHIPNNDGSTDEYWLGAPFPSDWEPDCDKLSLVVFGHSNLGPEICGLVFDEWTEIIPIETQTSGIAFHYNQPDARPPQALLLAVAPKLTGDWSLDVLGHIVEEAYKMARIRAIEPDHFNDSMLAQLLPATSLLAGGLEDVVRAMFNVETSNPFHNKKGAVVDFRSIKEEEEES